MSIARRTFLLSALSLLVGTPRRASARTPSPVLEAMKAELGRSMEALRGQPVPPYFLSYEITDVESVRITGGFGAVTGSSGSRRRALDIDVRVGDYALDNTRPIRGGSSGSDDRFSRIEVPVDNDPDAIRSVLWYHTDRRYRAAVERLTKVRTNVQVKVEQEDRSADFSREPGETYSEESVPIVADRVRWVEKVRRYTAPFARHADIYEATATVGATAETRWLVNSEGAAIQCAQIYYSLSVSAATKAADGMELPRFESFFALTPDGLPDDATVLKAVDQIIRDLEALKRAPVVEPYTGPAILSGSAGGVFFHEVFGHRIEGHREKREEAGQTFKKKINEQVLPKTFSVSFDPTRSRFGRTDLIGAYRYDNEGVKARRVPVVDRGVFRSFLMSRTPIEGMPRSNGHGRKQPGYAPAARQSNLIVQVSTPVSRAELKRMLIARVRKERKPFGLLFEDVQGGFTITGRTIPNVFNVLPVMVYRVYPDGREELVRGVDLIGTPLIAFSKIVAADDQIGVFNGICGAESGNVPVSAVCPGILISQIEVQKKEKSPERSPLLPAPPLEPA